MVITKEKHPHFRANLYSVHDFVGVTESSQYLPKLLQPLQLDPINYLNPSGCFPL